MIQDIFPHIYHNEMKWKIPDQEDFVLCYGKEHILYCKAADDRIDLPRVADLPALHEQLQYLFSIDERISRVNFTSFQISSPSKSTRPDVGFRSPLKCWIRVDLPDPVCPISPTNSPRWMDKLTSRSAARSNGVSAL